MHPATAVICMQTLYANGTNCSYIEFVPDFSPRGFTRKSRSFRAEARITKFEVDIFQYVSLRATAGFIIPPARILVSHAYPSISLLRQVKSNWSDRATRAARVMREGSFAKIKSADRNGDSVLLSEQKVTFARAFTTVALMMGIQLVSLPRRISLVKVSNVNGTSLEMATSARKLRRERVWLNFLP